MRLSTVLAVAGVAVGCATHTTRRDSNAATSGASASSVVTAKELSRMLRQGSLLDALERLRPSMLASRGTTPVVSVDGGPRSDLSVLRMIPVSEVYEVRLLRASSSVGQSMILANGDLKIGDVIAVTIRRGGSRMP